MDDVLIIDPLHGSDDADVKGAVKERTKNPVLSERAFAGPVVAAGESAMTMEWYGAFGLMVTLIWLYIEILRLLSKLLRR